MAATQPSWAAGFDPRPNRKQARPHGAPSGAAHSPPPLSGSEDPSHKFPAPPRIGRDPVGAALAATQPSWAAGFDPRPNREQARSHSAPSSATRHSPPLSGSEDPSHKILAPTPDRVRPLWERPWPRRGRRGPLASIQAAIASKLAPTALHLAPRAAHRSCRGRKTPPTQSRLRHRTGRHPCGSGLGRDAAVAGRRFRSRPQSRASSLHGASSSAAHCPPTPSGSEDPSHKITAPTKCPAELAAPAVLGSHPRSSPAEHP